MSSSPRKWRAFSDLADLDHVCEILSSWANNSAVERGVVSALISAIEQQEIAQRQNIETKRPGLFERTYLPGIYQEITSVLSQLCSSADEFANRLHRTEVLLHKVFIISLISPDELDKLRRESIENKKKVKRITDGHLSRADATDRNHFTTWVTTNNVVVANIRELIARNDFPSLTREYRPDALKKWYGACMPHVELKGGRPAAQKKNI